MVELHMTHASLSLPVTSVLPPCRASDSAISRKSSMNSLLNSNPFGFEAKTAFDAARDLTCFRSDRSNFSPPPVDDDIWRRPPPDFSPQVYGPRPPKRNTRASMKPWLYTSKSADAGTLSDSDVIASTRNSSRLPLLVASGTDDGWPPFLTHFDIAGPHETRVEFTRTGMFQTGRYVTPKPHDFRGLIPVNQLGIPEFDTSYEHDPFDIKFHSKRLAIMHGHCVTDGVRKIKGIQMAPPLKQPHKWQSRLILPNTSWPTKSGSYTRFRRMGRTPHSALLDRMEEALTVKWAKEKSDRQIKKLAK